MSKNDKQHVPVIGWFQPHQPVDWDGYIADPKTGELVKEPSMTKQSFVAECDINNIVKEFTQTGQVSHVNEKARQGAYVDLPDSMDFQQGLEMVRAAETAFMTLPAQVRARFGNDPAQFLEFFQDPANQEEAIKLGLASDTRPPEPAPKAPDPAPAPAPTNPQPKA